LSSAKNPVIVSGGGVVMADGVDQVKALAEALKVDIKVINWKIEKLIISQINEILAHNNYSYILYIRCLFVQLIFTMIAFPLTIPCGWDP
jgi:hypothetical protein